MLSTTGCQKVIILAAILEYVPSGVCATTVMIAAALQTAVVATVYFLHNICIRNNSQMALHNPIHIKNIKKDSLSRTSWAKLTRPCSKSSIENEFLA